MGLSRPMISISSGRKVLRGVECSGAALCYEVTDSGYTTIRVLWSDDVTAAVWFKEDKGNGIHVWNADCR